MSLTQKESVKIFQQSVFSSAFYRMYISVHGFTIRAFSSVRDNMTRCNFVTFPSTWTLLSSLSYDWKSCTIIKVPPLSTLGVQIPPLASWNHLRKPTRELVQGLFHQAMSFITDEYLKGNSYATLHRKRNYRFMRSTCLTVKCIPPRSIFVRREHSPRNQPSCLPSASASSFMLCIRRLSISFRHMKDHLSVWRKMRGWPLFDAHQMDLLQSVRGPLWIRLPLYASFPFLIKR